MTDDAFDLTLWTIPVAVPPPGAAGPEPPAGPPLVPPAPPARRPGVGGEFLLRGVDPPEADFHPRLRFPGEAA